MKKPPIQKLLQILARFSPTTLYRIAQIGAFFVQRVPNQISSNTRSNLRACFPDVKGRQFNELYRKSILHSCLSFVELAPIWCTATEKALQAVTDSDVIETFDQKARGQLIIVPHLGSWELLNLWLAQRGNLLSLYKPQKNISTNQFILDSRSKNGAQLVATGTAGLRQLMKSLKKGQTVMILPDQKPRKNKSHVVSQLFGQTARTSKLVHSLCERVNCDVYIGTALRNSGTLSYKILIESLDHSKLADDSLLSAAYMNSSIEKFITLSPEQYQWGYPRFGQSVYRATK